MEDSTAVEGLTSAEAARRLKEEGFNELPSAKQRKFLAIVRDVMTEPMFLLLLAAAGIYLALGDIGEALVLLGSVAVVIAISIYQQRKTERVLEALRDLASPRALVIRDGSPMRIPGREVVRGDILILAEGDRVPVDALLLECHDISVNESLLTGESLPVGKITWDGKTRISRPGGEGLPFVFSGTLVVQGHGLARAEATGARTEMGKIGKALQALAPEPTPLQRDTRRLVRNLALIGFVLCLLVAILYGFTRDNWLGGLLAGITLAMAILPEEFPVVLTVFLALGAWRISRNHVLTRRVPAIETLGEATVLCVDKTGTLTQNRMAVKQIQAEDAAWEAGCGKPFPASLREVAEVSVLASETDPFDPMEKAILELTKDHDERMLPVVRGLRLVHEYPLSRELLAVTHVWQAPDHEEFLVAAKGAPEAVLDLCRLDGAARQELAQQVASMAQRGLRVLGVAKAWYHGDDWPETPRRFNFRFVGLVGLADPIRPTVPRALEECYSAGIRVVMITGDYPGTAKAIAAQIGLHFRDEPITGIELEEMSDDELARRIKMVNIFARVLPEQKLRLVNAFKAIGDVVAMTGDGVNDAPALKAAHIGIAMGGRGTDVAREAASLVLLDDEFASIVKAVRLGRRIFDNLRKAMTYILAVHVPTVGMSFAPLLFGSPLVLFPVHIMFLEFVIDPACSVAFEAEPEEPDVMERPPRRPGEPLFSGAALWLGLLQGVVAWLAVLAVYGYSVHLGHNDRIIRAMTFSAIVAANLALIFANRSSRHTIIATLGTRNPALWWVVAVALASLGFALYVPWLAQLFQFSPLRFDELSLALAAGAASILWFEAFKLVKDSRAKRQAAQNQIA